MNMHLGLLFLFLFFFILEKSCLGWQAIFVIQIKRKQIAFIFNGRSKEKANRAVVQTSSKFCDCTVTLCILCKLHVYTM